jgi:uncharacterized iron-regulated membrane protein
MQQYDMPQVLDADPSRTVFPSAHQSEPRDRSPASSRSPRGFWVRVHRYAGLTTATFLTIAGLTGSVIAFDHELDEWLNPQFFRATGRPALSPLELGRQLEAADPRVRISYLPLTLEPGGSLDVFIEPREDAAGKPFEVEHNEIFLDPATGATLGSREWGACCFGREHLLPFLYRLHYTLHLPGDMGLWIMGIVALIWMLDSGIGFYLTLPRGRPFWHKWKTSWTVKRGAGKYRFNFDLHRAGGLWLWLVLVTLAVTAVSLTLGDRLVRPVVALFSPLTPDLLDEREERSSGKPLESPVSRDQAVVAATREAAQRGWTMAPSGMYYSSLAGVYGVNFGSDHPTGFGYPTIYVDAADGRILGAEVPGQGTAGDLFLQIQFPLHSGQIGGLPTRILISCTGLGVAMLSVTGVVIWLRKSRGRARRAVPRETQTA